LDIDDRPSKTRRKREMHELQALGERLVSLPETQLAAMELPERLRDAVLQARAITARGGLKRQLQYIGRLMREVDAGRIREAIERLDGAGRLERARHLAAEHWRTQLIEGGDASLEEFFSRYPSVERQRLRLAVRKAKAEYDSDRPPRYQRELFRLLHGLVGIEDGN
jgi:ribosome-associated protein